MAINSLMTKMVLTKNFAGEVPSQLVTREHKGLIKNVNTPKIQNQIKKNSQLVTRERLIKNINTQKIQNQIKKNSQLVTREHKGLIEKCKHTKNTKSDKKTVSWSQERIDSPP